MAITLAGIITPEQPYQTNIQILEDKIQSIGIDKSNTQAINLNFENAFAFPGLINSHDHLEFNLFPQLGNRVYQNYIEWGVDIHANNKKEINKVLAVPESLRVQWGIYKNLLNGVTTVMQHGKHFKINRSTIDVHQHCQSIHSVQLEKMWQLKLNNPFKKHLPIAIHIGEGIDKSSRDEIDELIKWNLIKRNLIGIHAVAMQTEQAKMFDAVVWCPDSNIFLLNKTAQIEMLSKYTKIVFGSDSTVSADWNLWKHLRLAKSTGMADNSAILKMLTYTAADVWQLKNQGELKSGYYADIVIVKNKFNTNDLLGSFTEINPEDILLVICKGRIVLFDEELYPQLERKIQRDHFSKIDLNDTYKYVYGNISRLVGEIKQYYPEAYFPITV